MSDDPAAALTESVEMYQQALCQAVSAYAPPCPECAGSMEATRIERVSDWHESGTGDEVIWAFESYRCVNGHRVVRRLELDRVTAEEREQEREKALKRVDRRRELSRSFGMFLAEMFRPGAIQRAVEAEYPPRPEPDLRERYERQVTGC